MKRTFFGEKQQTEVTVQGGVVQLEKPNTANKALIQAKTENEEQKPTVQ